MASNPYPNKIEYAGVVKLDLTGDTVSPEVLLSGYTAHDKSGKPITGTASGGGATIKTATKSNSSNSTSISFTGLSAKPLVFYIEPQSNISRTSTSTTRYVSGVYFDGTNISGGSFALTANRTASVNHNTSNFSYTYSNGTLTISSNSSTTGGYFYSGVTYKLVYVY